MSARSRYGTIDCYIKICQLQFFNVWAPYLSTHSQKLSTFLDQSSASKMFLHRGCRTSLWCVFYRSVHHFQTYESFFGFSSPFSSYVLNFSVYSKFEYFSLWALRTRERTRTFALRIVSHQKARLYDTSEVRSFRGGAGEGYAASTGYLLIGMWKN